MGPLGVVALELCVGEIPDLGDRFKGIRIEDFGAVGELTLGHSSVQLTLDTYSHLLPDMQLKERAAAHFDAVLRQTPTETGATTGAKPDEKVVSREGIEPSTRRLRVASGTRKHSKS